MNNMLRLLSEKMYRRLRGRYPTYFFHHIPKCGGTSVRKTLDDWFHVNDDYFDGKAETVQPPVAIENNMKDRCVTGHFGHDGYFLEQRYPRIFDGLLTRRRYRVFTFLRDPLAMRCSLYRHQIKNGQTENMSLAESIMTVNNYYARIMNLTDENWRKKLDRYFFVGNADELQTSFDVFARVINKPPAMLPVTNTTHSNHHNSLESLTPEQIDAFKQSNQLDYQLFDYAKDRLNRLRDKHA